MNRVMEHPLSADMDSIPNKTVVILIMPGPGPQDHANNGEKTIVRSRAVGSMEALLHAVPVRPCTSTLMQAKWRG